MTSALHDLLAEARACRTCAAHLPLGCRPVLAACATARLLIIGQAPGTRVHESGIPWNDPSGDRLRGWMGINSAIFYDPARVAIMPMGFCYPGRDKGGGDSPPRPECAPPLAWADPRPIAEHRTHLADRRLCPGLLFEISQKRHRDGARLARAIARYFSSAASVMAHQILGQAQPLVRGRGCA